MPLVSAEATSWVLRNTKGLHAARRMVLVAAADKTGYHGMCWASLPTLAEEADCSVDTVRRALEDATERGWIIPIAGDDPRIPAEWKSLRPDRKTRVWAFVALIDSEKEQPRTRSRRARPSPAAESQPAIPSDLTRGSNGVAAGSHSSATQTLEQENQEKNREPEAGSLSRVEPDCSTVGCDRGNNHPGPHQNPWWDAIEFALGYQAPEQQRTRFGRLATRARNTGVTPGQIIEAAAWIADAWGLEKLTINSLSEHLERALASTTRISPADLADFRQARERDARRGRMGVEATGTDGPAVLRLPGPERETTP